jgi:hypothetical protein
MQRLQPTTSILEDLLYFISGVIELKRRKSIEEGLKKTSCLAFPPPDNTLRLSLRSDMQGLISGTKALNIELQVNKYASSKALLQDVMTISGCPSWKCHYWRLFEVCYAGMP